MESRRDAAHISPAFIYATFFVTGVITTLLGPLLPQLAARWSVDDLHAGYLFTSQFAGSLAGTLLSGIILPKLGFARALSLGYFFMAAGVMALSFAGWHAALAVVFCIGIGLGITIPGTNLLFAEMNPTRRASALSTLNFTWGIGAVVIPIFVFIAGTVRSGALLIGIAVVSAAISVTYLFIGSAEPARNERARAKTQLTSAENRSHMDALFWILGVMFFFYVGTESAAAGWIASYAQRLDSSAHLSGILAPSFFWTGLLLGRAVAPIIFRHVREIIVARSSLLLATVGVSITYLAAGVIPVMAGAVILGLGLGPIYPIVVAEISGRFGEAARRISAILFGMSALGGACLPWMVGFVSTRTGHLRTGLLVIFAGTLILIALSFVSFQSIARHEAHPAD